MDVAIVDDSSVQQMHEKQIAGADNVHAGRRNFFVSFGGQGVPF